MHPLLDALQSAAHGRFPEPDGGVTFVEPSRAGIEAVVAFTGHAFVMTSLGPGDFAGIEIDGLGKAQSPEALLRLARGGRIGVLDATLVWMPGSRIDGDRAHVTARPVDSRHRRIAHAVAIRDDVRVYAGPEGLVTLASGLAGRQEMSVEANVPGQGNGRRLIRSAQAMADPERPLFAAVSPGNARSFRAFQSEGFSLLASEVVVEVGD